MRKLFIKHDNLRRILEELHCNMDNLSDELVDRFINELKHSLLIIAADISQNEIKFRLAKIDDNEYGFLFTDMDEFRKSFSDEECESNYYDFNVYKTVIEEGILDGFVINPDSEAFIFKKDLFLAIDKIPQYEFTADEVYSADELKNLKDSMNNNDLEEFITDSLNIGKYEELFEKISNSTLLTLMLSDDDLSEYSDDGVINLMETGPLGFLYVDEIGGNYATVYTCEDKISNVFTEYNKYSQIVNFSQMVNFILSDDMDGIIINPNSDHVLLTREVLFEYCPLLEKTCNDTRLNTAIMHMFLIEGEI